ncbi:hypothetical protein GCM10022199_14580 [Marihabitans asiaticum]|uniref:Uncharacterized protein n=1 Tax=Marihabitans asiaticum TaxID=415218 RepID=A0A560W8B3_9MICO|nr:hypothetical protein [Marihabitans asiaticum]TWD13848.1 hypothetical protein FB557_2489 [Marihabitans asiaticum]
MASRPIQSRGGKIAGFVVLLLVFGAMLVLGTWGIAADGDTGFALAWAAILIPVVAILLYGLVGTIREGRPAALEDLRPVDGTIGTEPPPGDGSSPWSLGQVAAGIARRLDGAPYRVLADDDTIVVTADLADARWRHLLTARGLKDTMTVVLRHTGGRSLRRTDETRQIEWHAGVPSIGASAKVSSGRQWGYRRQINFAVTERGVSKPVDYEFSTADLNGPIRETMQAAGWKTALSADAKGGLAMAAFVGVSLAVMGVFALVTQL